LLIRGGLHRRRDLESPGVSARQAPAARLRYLTDPMTKKWNLISGNRMVGNSRPGYPI
jgi:hypothetical protein